MTTEEKRTNYMDQLFADAQEQVDVSDPLIAAMLVTMALYDLKVAVDENTSAIYDTRSD